MTKEQQEKKKPGRPVGIAGKRVQTTIYASIGTLQALDEHIQEQDSKEGGEKNLSRSELYHRAMEEYMKNHGIKVKEGGR